MVWTKVALNFLFKIFTYKKGASVLFSMATSIFLTISIDKYVTIFMKDTDPKVMFISVLIQIVMLAIFLLLLTYDFLLGVRVSMKKKGEDFNWDKVFDTTAKIVGIGLLTTMVMFLGMVSESVDSRWAWWVATSSQSFLWILSNGFEYGSIGRHIENLRGDKPAMFKFFDRLLETLQNSAIKKIENSFNILEDKPENNTTNEDNTTKSE